MACALLRRKADKLYAACTKAAYGNLYDKRGMLIDWTKPAHTGLRERIEAANACLSHVARAVEAVNAGNCPGAEFYVRQAGRKAVRATRKH